MSTKPQDASTTLDAIEEVLDLRRVDPDALLPKLATLLLSLQGDSPLRPRVHRMLGVLQIRLNLYRDALRELGEAKALAERSEPPNYRELAKIGRETAAIYGMRGDNNHAMAELLPALATAALEGDDREIARIIADLGKLELDAQRFTEAATLLRQLALKGPRSRLPPSESQRVRIDLSRALNRLGAYDEALQHIANLQAELPEDETSFRCVTWLEEARAQIGRRKLDAAEQALREAEKLLPAKDSAFERSEFLEAVAELQEARGGPPAVKSLERLVEDYGRQRSVVREVVACRALAGALFKRRQDRARSILGKGLREALQANLMEVADDIRADLLQGADAEHVEDLSETIDLIGGDGVTERRFVRLNRTDRGGADNALIDLNDGRYATLKKIDLGDISESQRQSVIDGVRKEYAAAVRIINDPSVAPVLDLRMAPQGALYVVQSHVPGPTLRELYASGSVRGKLLDILAGIADALAGLHERGIAHRDLTPDNIIVARDAQGLDRPVLVNLGIAQVVGGKNCLRPVGKAPYVAPEQRAGEPGDSRADIYALGQMISEVWSGKAPPRLSLKVFHRSERTAVPRQLYELVRSMLQQDPHDRTHDLTAVAKALRAEGQTMRQT
jgi:tetratricopeptide (TPR) repeat protein